MITIASKLAEIKTVRCGVIPYTTIDSKVLFLLARDSPTKELGDFGGGVRKSEFSLMAGLREFYEESRGIFSNVFRSANDVCNHLAVVDQNKMAIIFVPLDSKWIGEAQKLFNDRENMKKSSNEVCELVWVDEDKFKALISYNGRGNYQKDVMWKKVRYFFSDIYKNNEFSDTLKRVALISRIGKAEI